MKTYRAILLIFVCAFFSFSTLFSQSVGINADGTPADPSAILDVKSSDKGMLVPRMTSAERTGIATPADGLIVYDTDLQGFYSFNQVAGDWTSMGVPLGGIIMWSGTTPPEGWALCTGQTVNSVTTPDLRGRFIVGYNPGDGDYNATGKNGGVKNNNHRHTINHDHPNHNTSTGSPSSAGGTWLADSDYWASGNHNHSVSVNLPNWNGNSGYSNLENRPPYYTLAFIMKVK
jgi:microcystin-dependent protein